MTVRRLGLVLEHRGVLGVHVVHGVVGARHVAQLVGARKVQALVLADALGDARHGADHERVVDDDGEHHDGEQQDHDAAQVAHELGELGTRGGLLGVGVGDERLDALVHLLGDRELLHTVLAAEQHVAGQGLLVLRA